MIFWMTFDKSLTFSNAFIQGKLRLYKQISWLYNSDRQFVLDPAISVLLPRVQPKPKCAQWNVKKEFVVVMPS